MLPWSTRDIRQSYFAGKNCVNSTTAKLSGHTWLIYYNDTIESYKKNSKHMAINGRLFDQTLRFQIENIKFVQLFLNINWDK